WLDAGHTVDELLAIIEATAEYLPDTSNEASATVAVSQEVETLPPVGAQKSKQDDLLNLWSPVGRTESANGHRFAIQHGAKVRYCATWGKWLIYDGTRWEVVDICRVESLAKATGSTLWAEILAIVKGD